MVPFSLFKNIVHPHYSILAARIAVDNLHKQTKDSIKDVADQRGVRLYEPHKKRPQNLSHPYYWAPFILIGNSQ